ncbi:MAG: sigma-54-dependent Fis family transcriptional regulator [bacterium]|nr:sigma-54-dependent Fis family transcriptional regulator [bacterium]
MSINETWGIIGESEKIRDVIDLIRKVADTDVPVLIQGESGTGKEMVTRAIVKESSRNEKDMVSVNCGAIPEGILESELFGHEKGAFTGAHIKRVGYFEMAHKGTIFLDEIGEMSLQTQVKLLRVLELGEYMKVGSAKVEKTDARVIAATNKDLAVEIKKGNFREDLFYRLKTVTITLPPLRERIRDIPLFIDKFVADMEEKYKLKHRGFDQEVIECLLQYEWPGNVRELKNFIESLVLLKKGDRVYITDLPDNMCISGNEDYPMPVKLNKPHDQAERELIYAALLGLRADINDLKNMIGETLNKVKDQDATSRYHSPLTDITEYINKNGDPDDDISVGRFELEAIREALKRYNGNRRLAAKALGMSERTLYRKLKKL